ncbi:hypothetical protein PtB15_9B32 [Puccinia triticina]|nr:hypothetical protein PtB15_9B32 [Puccinia triticina]
MRSSIILIIVAFGLFHNAMALARPNQDPTLSLSELFQSAARSHAVLYARDVIHALELTERAGHRAALAADALS